MAPQVRGALSGREVVIVATNSTEPVLDAEWIGAGTHVTTLGPKTLAHHEVPRVLADRAHLVLTDSRSQAVSCPEPHLVEPDRMAELGALLAGTALPSGPARTRYRSFAQLASQGRRLPSPRHSATPSLSESHTH
ncbi:hypothetical protein ACFC0M_01075 [Streptomyces sp. NPDC056149]|uniref:hypothetical protein n=1 Tax=Streptomyces sp. NPDC056149 TaxID=3345728 RepID=UPI0035D9E80E